MLRNKVVWDKHCILTDLLCGISFYYVTVDFALCVPLSGEGRLFQLVCIIFA